jgi:N-methylhydantoinase A/oxoprolinase/acetone carboxylase beta subunit
VVAYAFTSEGNYSQAKTTETTTAAEMRRSSRCVGLIGFDVGDTSTDVSRYANADEYVSELVSVLYSSLATTNDDKFSKRLQVLLRTSVSNMALYRAVK